MRFGLLRNDTHSLQSFGRYTLRPYSTGRVPYEIIEGLRRNPSREFTIIEDDPAHQVFFRTENEPFNPRYRERGRLEKP